jgi:ubiquinone/menaquinone biosynthesis C-methylase UbiE
MKQEKVIKKYNKQATKYEKSRDNPTVASWRRRVIKDAYGSVLEVGIGAGANFPYYNKNNITEVTGVDFSIEMIKSAKRAASQSGINARFITQDISSLQLESNSYDTIVSTLTLCSYPNPIEILNQFNSWCRKDGRILLLEHGLSTNPLLSFSLKAIDPIYKRFAGCHCNRNMLKLVEESQLQIEKVERYWSGIAVLIWARPNKI